MDLAAITGEIIDAGLKVHRTLGPGLLESIYEACLAHELIRRGIPVERQVQLPIIYEDLTLEAAYRIDLIVRSRVVVEVKSVESLLPVHKAQTLTYLKLTKRDAALLLNFSVSLFKQGIYRFLP